MFTVNINWNGHRILIRELEWTHIFLWLILSYLLFFLLKDAMRGTPVMSQVWPRPLLLNSHQASMQKFQGNRHCRFQPHCLWSNNNKKYWSVFVIILMPYFHALFSRHCPVLWGSASHGNWEPAHGDAEPCNACAAIPGHSSNHGSFGDQYVSRQIHVNLSYRCDIWFLWKKNLGFTPLAFRGIHLRGLAVLPTLSIHLLVAGHCPSFYWEDLQRLS